MFDASTAAGTDSPLYSTYSSVCTHLLSHTHAHFPAHRALCSQLLLPLMKKTEVSRGRGTVCVFVRVGFRGTHSADVLEIDKTAVSNHITVHLCVLKTCQLQS